MNTSGVEKIFSKWIVYLLKFYRILGFFTDYTPEPRINQKCPLLLQVLHGLTGISLLIFGCRFIRKPELFEEVLLLANGLIKFFCSLACYWLSVVELYAKRKSQRNFWRILERIDLHYYQHDNLQMGCYLVKLIEFMSVITMTHIVRKHNAVFDDLLAMLVFYGYYVAMEICMCRSFYYLFYVEVIKHELQIIENEVREMAEVSQENSAYLILKYFRKNRFKWTRDYYQLVYALTGCMNSMFGFSQLATIMFPFIVLVTDIAWIHWSFQFRTLWHFFGLLIH